MITLRMTLWLKSLCRPDMSALQPMLGRLGVIRAPADLDMSIIYTHLYRVGGPGGVKASQ